MTQMEKDPPTGRAATYGNFVVCICGGRDYTGTVADAEFLDSLHKVRRFTMVIHGGAPGADAFGLKWAISSGIRHRAFPADWETHGKAAGPRRNAEMAARADLVVAFPGGRGTEDMVRKARRSHVPVLRLRHSPRVPRSCGRD